MQLPENEGQTSFERVSKDDTPGRKYWDPYDIAQQRTPLWQSILNLLKVRFGTR